METKTYTESEMKELASKIDWTNFDNMTDDDIDFSDIQELTDEFLKNAIICKNGVPIQNNTKSEICLRLDKEIVDYYKGLGANWQDKLNDTLLCVLKLRNIL